MISKRGYLIASGVLLLLAAGNLLSAWGGNRKVAPTLVLTASHDIPANHKMVASDFSFALLREPTIANAITRPNEALGSCSRVAIEENHLLRWNELTPPITGNDTCGSVAIVLQILDRVTRLPKASAPTAAQNSLSTNLAKSELPSVLPLQQWLADDLPSEVSPAVRSALGDFRGEFIKEFAKRLASNAADRIFGRESTERIREEGAIQQPPRAESKPDPTPNVVVPKKVIYFSPNGSVTSRAVMWWSERCELC